jgi:biotin operon repressor
MLFNYLSGVREDCGEVSVNEVLEFAVRAAGKCMNEKRAEMLRLIAGQKEPKTITSVVEQISCALDCPRSTVWANLNTLKELGLVENGRGKPLHVTNLGKMVLDKFLLDARKAGIIRRPGTGVFIYSEAAEDLVPV